MRARPEPLLVLLAALAMGCGSPSTAPTCPAKLAAGDLVITELTADPAGADEGKEWLEIYNTTDKTLDLTQVRLVSSKADGTGEKLHVVAGLKISPKNYMVLGGMLEAARPAWVDYVFGSDLGGLPNAGGALALRCGTTLVDKVVYANAVSGKSKELDGSQTPDAVANDDLALWCESSTEFEPGVFGTPGSPNDVCGGGGTSGTCKGQDGMMRPTSSPLPGQLVINEIMANPATGTDETKGEWFEVVATAQVDLNGLQLASSADPTVLKAVGDLAKLDCITVDAGGTVLFVRSKDPLLNGGVPMVVPHYAFNFSLSNSGGTLSVGAKGAIVDTVVYPTTADGVSHALDQGWQDAAQNDDVTRWCKGVDVYGAGGKGTPGAANASCGFVDPGNCLDGATQRPKVTPVMGDLVINEVMPNPSGDETKKEWFELKVTRAVDLNGLQIGADATKLQTIPEGVCRRVTAGSYAVFARSADPLLNGGLPAIPPGQTFTFTLTNAPGQLLLVSGAQTLDTYMWTASTDAQAWSLDPAVAAKWCKISDPARLYNGVDFGTPGGANPACP